MNIKGYTIRSTSEEGIYYLVNGWNRKRAFWKRADKIHECIFKTIGQAKASLTKLLKVMDDYRNDTFELVEIREDGCLYTIPSVRL